jgi:DNA polymerase-3 subunit epsilon
VKLARRRFPGAPASLDSLCKRFGVDNSGRTLHGALLDAQLLAECYVELLGGRQHGFALAVERFSAGASLEAVSTRRAPRAHGASDAELLAHAAMIAEIKSAIWSGEG